MIGATTENPFFSVTPAIRSRVQIFELEPLANQDVKEAIQIALTNPERGFDFPVELDGDALDFIATSTNGDLRSAFNSLDLAVLSTPENDNGIRHITLDIMENSLQRSYITMDKDGDGHYDVLSALQNPFAARMWMPVSTTQPAWLKLGIFLASLVAWLWLLMKISAWPILKRRSIL